MMYFYCHQMTFSSVHSFVYSLFFLWYVFFSPVFSVSIKVCKFSNRNCKWNFFCCCWCFLFIRVKLWKKNLFWEEKFNEKKKPQSLVRNWSIGIVCMCYNNQASTMAGWLTGWFILSIFLKVKWMNSLKDDKGNGFDSNNQKKKRKKKMRNISFSTWKWKYLKKQQSKRTFLLLIKSSLAIQYKLLEIVFPIQI